MSISRITKRKLDDAIQTLDDILNTSNDPPTAQPSPKKRPNTSIYKSLNNLFRSSSSSANDAPSTSSRKFPGTPISGPFALSSKPPYRPDSTSDFLSRLATFKMSTYRNKPDAVNPVAAAKAGWTNEGKDRLICGFCSASWVVATTQGMTQDAANTLTERHRQSLITAHKDHCPWRKAQCNDSVYRLPLKGATAMARQLKAKATALAPFVKEVSLKHPMTAPQVSSLVETLSIVPLSEKSCQELADEPSTPSGSRTSLTREGSNPLTSASLSASKAQDPPSETACILALFGWELMPYQPSSDFTPGPVSSYSRATSPSISSPATSLRTPTLQNRHSLSGSLGRASGQTFQPMPHGTPSTLTSHFARMSATSLALGATTTRCQPRTASGGNPSIAEQCKNQNIMLGCELCQRKLGLWTFLSSESADGNPPQPPNPSQSNGASPPAERGAVTLNSPLVSPNQPSATFPTIAIASIAAALSSVRQLDVLKEHRTFCPYIVNTTVVPTPIFSTPLTSYNNPDSSGPQSGSLRKSLSLSLGRPSLASGDSVAVEGWRAVLNVVSRYGMGIRMRRTGSVSTTASIPITKPSGGHPGRTPSVSFAVPNEGVIQQRPLDAMDVDGEAAQQAVPSSSTMPALESTAVEDEFTANSEFGVEKIVENVKKSREGSRELLRYVKDLLRRGEPTPSSTSDASSMTDSRGCLPRRHSSVTFRLGRISPRSSPRSSSISPALHRTSTIPA